MTPQTRDELIRLGEIEPAPAVPEWLQGVWGAWHRLHSDRPWRAVGLAGMMPGPIPWRDIVSWCEFHALAHDVTFYDAIIRKLDAVFLDWHAARQPKV